MLSLTNFGYHKMIFEKCLIKIKYAIIFKGDDLTLILLVIWIKNLNIKNHTRKLELYFCLKGQMIIYFNSVKKESTNYFSLKIKFVHINSFRYIYRILK